MTARPISETVASLMPRAREELAELVAFQSVADPAVFPRSECEGAARWVADALRAEGFTDVALLDTPDGTQSVYGFLPGPAGAPSRFRTASRIARSAAGSSPGRARSARYAASSSGGTGVFSSPLIAPPA